MELKKEDMLKNLFSVSQQIDPDEMKITMLPIDSIDSLTSVEHAFEKSVSLDLEELAESIKLVGVQEPIIVRPKEGGRYESVAGHRRKLASVMAGKSMIPAIIREINDYETTVISTDTNLKQRGHIFPSERAKAYQMQLEVLKAQGKRTDLIRKVEAEESEEDQVKEGKKSRDMIAERYRVSPRTISNYVRLLLLSAPILEFVDNEKLTVMIGVSISYLSEDHQALLFQIIEQQPELLTKKKAETLKMLEQQQQLTEDVMRDIFLDKKKEQMTQKAVYQTALKKVERFCKKLDQEEADLLFRCSEDEIVDIVKEALQSLLKKKQEEK